MSASPDAELTRGLSRRLKLLMRQSDDTEASAWNDERTEAAFGKISFARDRDYAIDSLFHRGRYFSLKFLGKNARREDHITRWIFTRASSRDNLNNYRAIIVLPDLLLDAEFLRDQTD